MKWVKDTTGRFPERPHYDQRELDMDCEAMAHSILRKRNNGVVRFPITTDDLQVMIEDAGADLDLYADLSAYGENVEGVTEFKYGVRPLVRISRPLIEDSRMENRLRTTLTHECGHVKFHHFLWKLKGGNQSLFVETDDSAQVCKRDRIILAGTYDWMEWQAGYSCGALLMPLSDLRRTCQEFIGSQGIGVLPIYQATSEAEALIEHVTHSFEVSRDAARVRLMQVSLLADGNEVFQKPLWG